MQPRFNYQKESYRGALQAMLGVEHYVRSSGLEPSLLDLVKARCSQINGCAYCINMHTKDARAAGETEQRLYGLNAWRECPFYSERERAALELSETLTLISTHHFEDALFESVRQQFSEQEFVTLCMAVVAINGWNRLMIAARAVPGSYQPAAHAAAHL